MIGLRERVALVGGTLTAGPTADGGWQVDAVLPIAATGQLGTAPFFPNASSSGLEGSGGLRLRVAGPLEITASATMTRYQHVLNAEPGEGYFADGALDVYLNGVLGLRLTL